MAPKPMRRLRVISTRRVGAGAADFCSAPDVIDVVAEGRPSAKARQLDCSDIGFPVAARTYLRAGAYQQREPVIATEARTRGLDREITLAAFRGRSSP